VRWYSAANQNCRCVRIEGVRCGAAAGGKGRCAGNGGETGGRTRPAVAVRQKVGSGGSV